MEDIVAVAVVKSPSMPVRDDIWSEDATATLIEAWGERYLGANRGNIRQQHWQELADAVNNRHGLNRTDIQCKNRIDTVKKKYKVEKARVSKSKSESEEAYVSTWPFFQTMDGLFGSKITKRSKKRQARAAVEEAEAPSVRKRKRKEEKYGEVATAIERLGEIYERVERKKQIGIIELEKQRMKFMQELECHKMKMLVESEIQIQKMRHAAAAAAGTTTAKRYSASAPTALSSFMTLLFSN
ncbi:hypothetical protein LWI28_006807 [Acer negundo]|uniref:Myb/SANT-like DNA-binding domain-containing protein n=1 Tax=Acer negundo TaxID=4023 RepID=A0AAD5NRH6_ACENE|nr:hypothetical protein LWI28_006807 [Acer negundo]KAK4845570.1 hypothetical protein QYF36_006615 [Acer negundo]